jgi:hypothetical protein
LGVREVYSRSCSGEIQEFTKNIVLELIWACSDVLSLDDPEIEDIEAAFVTSYNAAASTYSEPFFRTLTGADIVLMGEATADGNLVIELRVTGNCRGCNPEDVEIYGWPPQ